MSQPPVEVVPQTEAQNERNAKRFHVEFLRLELERRKQRNARYSLRAFASLLGIHPSALSRILSGKQEVSLPSAAALLKQLAMTPEERLWFVRSVAEERFRRAVDELTADGGEFLVPIEEIATTDRKLFELCLSLLAVTSLADLMQVSSLYLRDLLGAVSVSIYRPRGDVIELLCTSNKACGLPSAWSQSLVPFPFNPSVAAAPKLMRIDTSLFDENPRGVLDPELRVALLPLLCADQLNSWLMLQIPKNDIEREPQLVADLSRLLGQVLASPFIREDHEAQ